MNDENVKITNMTQMSLSIQELGVSLPGRGDYKIIESDLAKSSITLKEFVNKRWVKLDTLKKVDRMSHWPFHKPTVPVLTVESAPSSTNDIPSSENSGVLSEIRDLLKIMIDKQTSPEVLATHIALQSLKVNKSSTPGAIHVSGKLDQAPEFIPSKIVPTNIDASIKSVSRETEKSNLNETAQALKNLRKK